MEIARQHLFPRQLKEHGLTTKHLSIGKKQLEKIVEGYTRESGVRGLEAKIAQVIRNAAKSIAMEEEYNKKVTDEDIVKVLGIPRLERDKYESNDVAGVVTGLAWTSVGGDILFIESLISQGKGGMAITGNLGNVMKESATIALEYIKANAELLGLSPEMLSKYNIHLHVPEGASSKRWPKCGNRDADFLRFGAYAKESEERIGNTRRNHPLRGKVLPVGGIKRKDFSCQKSQHQGNHPVSREQKRYRRNKTGIYRRPDFPLCEGNERGIENCHHRSKSEKRQNIVALAFCLNFNWIPSQTIGMEFLFV